MRKYFIAFLFIYLTLYAPTAKAFRWDPLGLHSNVDDMKEALKNLADQILKGLDNLLGKAKQVVSDLLDKLFDDKLTKMLAEVQAMIDKNLKQINQDIQDTIDHMYDKLSALVTQMAMRVKEIIQQAIDDIKTKIIDEFFEKFEILCSEITADVIKLLDKIDNLIYNLSCSEQALVDKIVGELTKTLPYLPNPFNACREQIDSKFPGHNLRWKTFSSYSPNELYEYKKCDLFINLNENSPISSIILSYRDLEMLAGDMRCVSMALRLTENLYYYIDEMASCVTMIDMYKQFSGPGNGELMLISDNDFLQ